MTLRRTPRQMKQWLDALSRSDVRETVMQLHDALASHNPLPLDHEEQIKLLETYRDLADEILLSFDDITLRTLPLEPEQRGQLSQSIAEIFLTLSRAYHGLVESAVATHESPNQSDTLLLATYRAIEYLALAALYCCKLRAGIPATVWSASKKLYLFAEQHGVAEAKIRKATGHAVTPTIDALFKQLCLFAIADPYRWPSAELHELFIDLETCAPFASLAATADTTNKHAYSIEMENDAAPRLPVLVRAPSIAANVRWLDCAPVLANIRQQIEFSGGSMDAPTLEREGRLLAEFYKRMHAPRVRREPRNATQHTVQIATGLEATCYFLSDPERTHRDKQCSVVGGIEVCEDENPFALTQWTAVNENVNGYMLVADATAALPEPPAGEVLALADCDADGAHRLRVGVVRWIRKPKSGAIYIGVEILEGAPQSIRCARSPATAGGATSAAIYFPAREGAPGALLIPFQLYAPAATVCVEIDAEQKLLDMDLPLTETPLHVLAAVFSAKC